MVQQFAQILARLAQLLGVVETVLGVVNQVRSLLMAKDDKLTSIDATVVGTRADLYAMATTDGERQDQTLAAIAGVRYDAASPHLATLTDILAAIDVPNGVVNLPPPPTGYGGAAAGDVWEEPFGRIGLYTNLFGTEPASAVLAALALGMAAIAANEGLPYNGNSLFRVRATNAYYAIAYIEASRGSEGGGPPDVDWSLWDGVETVADLLNRVDPTTGWAMADGLHGDPYTAERDLFSSGEAYAKLRCAVLPWQLPGLSGVVPGTLRRAYGPPIWPGVEHVLLGEPVALDVLLTLEGPFDGVVVEITEVPPRYGSYPYGDTECYQHVGAIAFRADNGAVEQYQPLGWASGILVPKSMSTAAGAVLRVPGGVVGTVTPWSSVTG